MFSNGKKQVKELKSQNESLNEKIEIMRRSESDLKKAIGDREKSKEELEIKNHQLLAENRQLSEENKDLKDKLDTDEPYEKIFNDRKIYMDQYENNTGKIKELESENKTLKEQLESMCTEIKRTKEELNKIKSNYETEKAKIDELFQQREGLDSRVDELEKEKCELEDELVKLKEEIRKKEEEFNEETTKISQQREIDEKGAKAYLEDVRRELGEYKTKTETLQLESEALKSENEALFRANESKKKDIDEILGELNSIRNELKLEQQRGVQLRKEWDEERKKTEFVIVSKSASKSGKKGPSRLDDDDSEDEHLVSVTEAARAEAEALREKERGLRKRLNQLQIDKEELFRSGTNLFAENKTVKAKYDDVCKERSRLLQSESKLQHKLREKENEIKDLKKTVDDLYYQNLAIKSNEDNESKTNSYVVLMGNETVKQLEREKSILTRRVKFLERENREIEQRVVEIEKQSDALIKYSRKYDEHTPFPPLNGPFDVDTTESMSTRHQSGSRERGRTYVRTPSRKHDHYSNEHSSTNVRRQQGRQWSNHKVRDDENTPRSTYRAPTDRQRAQHDYRDDLRPPVPRARSPDYYRDNGPPFSNQTSRQPSFAASNQSRSSRFSLPPVPNQLNVQRPDTRSDVNSRRNSLIN